MKVHCAMRQILFVILSSLHMIHVISKPTQSIEYANEKQNEIEIDDNDNNITNIELDYRIEYSKIMQTFMNESVDPCDDFYEYACGNWKNVIEKRQAQHKRGNLLDIVYKLNDATEKLLEDSSEDIAKDYAAELKITQQFYQSCLSANLYPMKKSQAYLEVINSIGGFPAVDETWNADSFSWFNMSAHLTNYGADGLIYEEIIPQYPFPPYFKLPDLGFDYVVHSDNIASNTSRSYESNEKRMRYYLTEYGVEEERISHVINNIFQFWKDVLNMMDEFDEDLDKCELISEISDVEQFSEWDNYFEISWMSQSFNSNILDYPCNYLYVKLDSICNEHKEAAANYFALKFLYKMDARLNDINFHKEYCIMEIQNAFTFLINKLYLLKYFNSGVRDEITTMVDEIRKSLREQLEEADWLDESTRSEALLKESTITSRIGSFEDLEMTERLIRAMNNITFVPNDYEQNNINLKKFERFIKRYLGLHYEELNNNTKPLELLVAMQVNAFYYNVDNSINVMAGILHPPAYHKSWPNSLKFGTLGYLVGHEFTHGFDSVGAHFNSNGAERYWWSQKSGKVFNERTNCYVDHFSEYLIPEINRKINGNITKDENIADNGGLREALSAYRRYMKDLSKETGQQVALKDEEMTGLSLSPEQLFFLGFAQLWCYDI